MGGECMFSAKETKNEYRRKVRTFKLLAGYVTEQNEELEKLLNDSTIDVIKTETSFDKEGNYVVAVWFDERQEVKGE
jgi:hypothetical protein